MPQIRRLKEAINRRATSILVLIIQDTQIKEITNQPII
jgi:hypothetical protein